MINYTIRIKDQLLYLHKSSNMFTTDRNQARRYKTYTGAENWIKMRNEINDYNVRFIGLEFIIVEIEG